MDGAKIIALLSSNLSVAFSAVRAVTGSLFTSIFLRHNTSTKEFEKLKAGKFQEVADELLAAGKMSYTEYYKANNFLKIAKKADEYYSEMPHNDKFEAYDFDWFVRFYEAVGNISNEEMQALWAKILAGEICHHSTYSLKTIDVLKNLSKEEANLFRKICSHAIVIAENCFFPNYDEYLEHCKIQYSDIMKLSEQGLIYNDAFFVSKVPINNETSILFANKKLLILVCCTSNKETKTLNIKQFPLTSVGCELSTLMDINTSDEDLMCFAKLLNEKNGGIDIEVHTIVNRFDGNFQFDKKNLLEDKARDAQQL